MTTLREAAQQVLQAYDAHEPLAVVMDALKTALAEPTWCEIHQHHKWCEHNGGKMGPTGWEAP